jgi:hypothetical protein
MKKRTLQLLCAFALMAFGQGLAHGQLTAAELISKHLDSIGSAETRALISAMSIKGSCLLTVRQGGRGQVGGQTLMTSKGQMNLINMTFDSPEYPFELLTFDGKDFHASQFKPGVRTSLAQFFVSRDALFKEGLIGGTLTSSWPLLDLQQRNPKLEYAGIKKIGGKQLHALRYRPRHSLEMKITLFFDSETFQHVRTEYEETIYTTDQQRIANSRGLPSSSGPRSSNARINAFEEFSDFKVEGGLNLPHTYKFELAIQSEVRPALVDWAFDLTEFTFNLPLNEGYFQPKNEKED